MWSGTDEDYLRLYRTAATTTKKQFPALKVGGPSLVAQSGRMMLKIRTVDAESDFSNVRSESVAGENSSLRLTLKAPAIALIRLRPDR